MKIIIIGIDGAHPEILFDDDSLVNLRRLMTRGCYGQLAGESLQSKEAAWFSLLTGRSTADLSAAGLDLSQFNSTQVDDNAGQWVGSPIRALGQQIHFLTSVEIANPDDPQLFDAISINFQTLFDQARALVQTEDWGFLGLVDGGIEQIHQAEMAGLVDQVRVRDYYLHLDAQIGALLELLDDQTLLLVVSPYGNPSLKETKGCYILASSNNPLSGEITDISLLDVAPTINELCGFEIPEMMQGKSIIADKALNRLTFGDLSAEEEEILRERLSGLGYIS